MQDRLARKRTPPRPPQPSGRSSTHSLSRTGPGCQTGAPYSTRAPGPACFHSTTATLAQTSRKHLTVHRTGVAPNETQGSTLTPTTTRLQPVEQLGYIP